LKGPFNGPIAQAGQFPPKISERQCLKSKAFFFLSLVEFGLLNLSIESLQHGPSTHRQAFAFDDLRHSWHAKLIEK